MKIFIASDHAGFDIKNDIINYLNKELGISIRNIEDCGTFNNATINYAVVAKDMIRQFIKATNDILPNDEINTFGILVCGSGIGVSIAANRYNQIRAALCYQKETAELSRMHNNANVLCLGSRITTKNEILEIVKVFLNTKFEGGRHIDRVCSLSKC